MHAKKTNQSYSELLRDPRWQKKRLKIMERDGFFCQSCQDSSSTLNVHHRVPYRKNTLPWEYEDDELVTLCDDCHKKISELIYTCNTIVMGRCWCVDSAQEMANILYRVEDMDPYELYITWNLIETLKKFK